MSKFPKEFLWTFLWMGTCCLSITIPWNWGFATGRFGCVCCWLGWDVFVLPLVVVAVPCAISLLCGIELEKLSQAVNSAWDFGTGKSCCKE